MNKPELPYSPKLKQMMAEIRAILKKNDVAGLVVLADPGHTEYTIDIKPSYSIVQYLPGGQGWRLKANLKNDFNGDKEKMEYHLASTSNILANLALIGGKCAIQLADLSELLDKHIDAEHGPGKHTSHEENSN